MIVACLTGVPADVWLEDTRALATAERFLSEWYKPPKR